MVLPAKASIFLLRRVKESEPDPVTTPEPDDAQVETPPGVTTTVARPTEQSARDARDATRQAERFTAFQLQQRFTESTQFLEQEENFEALSGGDDHITTEDLENAATDETLTEAQRAEAAFLLESTSFRHALDVGAGKGEVDGKISREDVEGMSTELSVQDWSGPTIGLDGAVDSEEEAMAVLDRYGVLADTADGEGGRNGHVSDDDVAALLQDPNLPPELRSAAEYLSENVDLPGSGGGFLDTVSSPFRSAGGWVLDRGADGLDTIGDEVRDTLAPPVDLSDEERSDLMDAAAAARAREEGRDPIPLNEQRNAHLTNTPEQMQEALEGDYQWLEGDVRRDPPVMGHDWQEAGLTLDDWLEVGKESGLGLKLDIKDSESVDAVIDAVQEAGIPSDRLILNVDALAGPGGSGYNVSPEQVSELREAFPDARIAIGAKTTGQPDGTTYTEAQVSEMIRIAETIGGPVMFPLRAEFVTPEIVERLSAHGDVSIWNSPGTYPLEDQAAVEAAEQRFRDMGVTGVIDLRDVDGH